MRRSFCLLVASAAFPSLGVAQSSGGGLSAAVVAGLPGPASLVAASARTSCAVVGGALQCWGWLGPVGIAATSATPRLVPGVRGVTQLSIGALGSCALTAANQPLCWGPAFSPRPAPVAGLASARKISTGEGFACALREDGRVACWGANQKGELGQLPPDPNRPTPAPAKPRTPRDATIALLRSGGPAESTLAQPELPASKAALVVPLLDDVVDLAAGTHHACAVRGSGEVVCWGDRSVERGPDSLELMMGRGPGAPPRDPAAPKPGETRVLRSGERTTIPTLTDAVAVSAVDRESCALGRDGALSCFSHAYLRTALVGPKRCVGVETRALGDHTRWIVTASGEIARVGESGCSQPRPEPGVTGAVEVSGPHNHACARTTDGKIICLGINDAGQLGRPATPALLR